MAGNGRENTRYKGFWDGGTRAHNTNGQSGGRASGYPGSRAPKKSGLRVDLEFPNTERRQEPEH